ncbi:MAG: FlgO family outer membrane protein [Desulfobulbaceae bacterium]|nr:FlgO family outer membrane protein [Desulfobulbaceae bacterium]HIJ89344.1 hypothetical protein [Deltaproteobacteria bacterium]
MKKGRRDAILCCLGLVLFAGTGCVTVKQEAKPAGNPDVKIADAALSPAPARSIATATVVPGKAVAGPSANGQKEQGDVPLSTEVRRVPTKYNVYQYMPDTSKTLGTEILLSEISKEVAGKVFYEMQEEGEKNFTSKIAVVNAVPLSDLKRETEFGRVIGEYLLTDLADRGLKVTELRMGKDITILPQTGEFILSRNIGELANKMPELEYVVVTTFANTRKTLVVQGRLVRLADGAVKTSWRYSMPLNRELLGLFQPAETPYKIAVKGIGR